MTVEAVVTVLIALADAEQRARVTAAARLAGLACVAAGAWSEALALWRQEDAGILLTGAAPRLNDGVRLIHEIRAHAGSYSMPVAIFLGGGWDTWAAAQGAGADQCLPADAGEPLLAAVFAAAARRVRTDGRAARAVRGVEAMAEAVPDGIVSIDASGTIRWANTAALTMFGYQRHELLGCDVGLLAPEPHRSAHGGYIGRYRKSGVRKVIGSCREVAGQRKDGSMFPLELSVSEVRHRGTPQFVGVLRDVSARRAIEEELRTNADRLERLRAQHQTENELAQEVVERLLRTHGREDPLLRYQVAPAEEFSGDVVAALRSSAGRLYVMLADATGHGLAAAISLLPAISVFYGMAARNLPLAMIVGELNQKLRNSMPVGRFVAAALACIDDADGFGEVWVGGTPDLLWLDGAGRVLRCFPSNRVALGILDSTAHYAQPEAFDWQEAGQLFACSDGVLEAQDAQGQHFGMGRLLSTLAGCAARQRVEAVQTALDKHANGAARLDDVSLLSIDLPV